MGCFVLHVVLSFGRYVKDRSVMGHFEFGSVRDGSFVCASKIRFLAPILNFFKTLQYFGLCLISKQSF
jgi:hypothetical protein